MKKSVIFLFSLVMTSTAFAQLGSYNWFKLAQIPYYENNINNFDAYRNDGGTERNGFMPGYYINKNGEKVDGEVQYNYPFLMERILVFRKDGVKTIFSPKDVNAFFVDGMLFESVTINASFLGGATRLETYFMIPEIKGKLSLYYYSGENPTDLDSDADFGQWNNYYTAYRKYMERSEVDIQKFTPKTRYLKKENEVGIAVEPMAFGFANKMSKLVSDCADVSTNVKNKEKGYRVKDLEMIVDLYNRCEQ